LHKDYARVATDALKSNPVELRNNSALLYPSSAEDGGSIGSPNFSGRIIQARRAETAAAAERLSRENHGVAHFVGNLKGFFRNTK
jgi:hypothetical protein